MSDERRETIDPVLKHLQLLQARAEARKARAEAASAELAALLPALPAAIEGDAIDVPDDGSPLAIGAGYVALSKVAASVAQTVTSAMQGATASGATTRYLVVTGDRYVRTRTLRGGFRSGLARCSAAVDEVMRWLDGEDPRTGQPPPKTSGDDSAQQPEVRMFGPPAVAALGAVGSLLSSAVPLVASLVRVKRTVRNQSVELSELAVVNEFAQQLRTVEGQERVVHVGGVTATDTTKGDEEIRTLGAARDALARRLVEYRNAGDADEVDRSRAKARLDFMVTVLTDLAKKADGLPAERGGASPTSDAADQLGAAAAALATAEQAIARRVSIAEHVQQVIEMVDQFLEAATTPDDGGLTATVAAAEVDLADDDATCVVLVEASFAGAESKYEEHLAKNDVAFHGAVVTLTYSATRGPATVSGTKTMFTPVLHNLSTHDISVQHSTVLDN